MRLLLVAAATLAVGLRVRHNVRVADQAWRRMTATTCRGCGDWFAVAELVDNECAGCRRDLSAADMVLRDAMRMRGA